MHSGKRRKNDSYLAVPPGNVWLKFRLRARVDVEREIREIYCERALEWMTSRVWGRRRFRGPDALDCATSHTPAVRFDIMHAHSSCLITPHVILPTRFLILQLTSPFNTARLTAIAG